MKDLYRHLLTIVMVLLLFVLQAQNTFATSKLEQLSHSLPNIKFSTLAVGEHKNFSFRKHPLKIHVNQWNEVDHIGFYFFDSITTAENPTLYNFIERYFFELMVSNDPDQRLRMALDHFSILEGSYETIFGLQPTDILEVSWMDMKRYVMSWKRNGKSLLTLSFSMDYQLLVGCNAIELEHNYLRNLSRGRANESPEQPLPQELDTCLQESFTQPGSSFMTESINNNRYYTLADDGWQLVCSAHRPDQSAYNILLSPTPLGRFDLNLSMDMYGYKTKSAILPMSEWVGRCLDEGCETYLGIKEITDNMVKATILCPNKKQGYCHILSIELPLETIHEREGSIKGRLYAYIPIHEMSPKLF